MLRTCQLAETLFLALPLPLSKLVHSLARATLFKDSRTSHFDRVFRGVAAAKLEGDYLEFGVYRGSSFTNSYRLAQKHGLTSMRFFAFDSFRGLPHGEEGKFGANMYSCSKQRFVTMIRKAGVDLNKVHIVEGFYEDSLTEQAKRASGIERAAVVHLDCDLYASTAAALDFVSDWIDEGSVVIFDDWKTFEGSDGHGQSGAFKHWRLSSRFQEIYDAGHSGKAFICTKPVRTAA